MQEEKLWQLIGEINAKIKDKPKVDKTADAMSMAALTNSNFLLLQSINKVIDKLDESKSEGSQKTEELKETVALVKAAIESIVIPEVKIPPVPPVDFSGTISALKSIEEKLSNIKIPAQQITKIDLSQTNKAIQNLEKKLESLKQDPITIPEVVFPTDAKSPMSVRLSDGEEFYKALDAVYQVATGGGGGVPKVQSTTTPAIYAVPVVNPDGSNISGGGGGGGGDASAANQTTQIAAEQAIQTAVEIMDDWDETDRAKVNTIVGQAGVQGGSGTVSTNTQRVVLATDVALPAGTNAIGKLAANSGVDIGDVDITSIAAGDNNIGNVDIVTVPADPFGANADAASATGSISAKLRFIAATGIPITGTVTISGTVTANAGTNLNTSALALEAGNLATATTSLGVMDDWDNGASDGASVSGDVAHDSADAGEPVKIGYKAIDHGSNPTAVTANDRTNAYANRHGIPFMIGGHPNILTKQLNITAADGAQTDTDIIGAISSGTKYVVTHIAVTASGANTVDVSCRIGFGTANVPANDAAGIILSHPGIKPGSGIVIGSGAGIIGVGGDGAELRVTSSVATGGALDVVVGYFTIES